MSALLSAENLTVHFQTPCGPARAVDDISFEISTGQTVGLVGESGCGKSVTALAILRLLPSHGTLIRGRLNFQGRDLSALDEADMRDIRGRLISMIFQEPMTSLNPVFTIGDQIAEILRLHLKMSRGQAAQAAEDMLAQVGFDRPQASLRSYPGELSGGMRQRAMIAMAMAVSPSLLMADEPTTALDVTTQAQILGLLDELRKAKNTAILLITHDLGVVAEICEQVVVLYAGQVAEIALVRSIFDRPLHPYTQGLMRAVGRINQGGIEAAIPGRVAPATQYPPGCRFAPRCQFVMDRCRVEHPPMLAVHESRAACWLLDGRSG